MINPGRVFGRLLALPALLTGLLTPSICQATLVGPGDLAFIRFNADGWDDFAIVLLADADIGQLVSFNTTPFDEVAGEFDGITGDHFVWEIDQALSAGTVVTFNDLDRSLGAPSYASAGIIQNQAGKMMALYPDGATLYAYLGTDAIVPGTFLAGISTNSTSAFNGTGLIVGQSAVYLPPKTGDEIDEGHYKGDRTGQTTFDDYLPLIGNVNANWVTRGNTVPPNFPAFDTSNFTLDNGAAVPESPLVMITGVLMLLACLSLGARWRRQPAVALAE